MAAITSAASGNWSAGATWAGGVAPTSADQVTVASPHAVTLNDTSCVADTLATAVGSTLNCTTANDWTLTLQRGGNLRGILNLDMSAVPTVTGQIIYHAINNTSIFDGQLYWNDDATTQVTMKGAPRKRLTNLTAAVTAGATTIQVADATGWRVGDRLALCSTQAYNVTPKTDYITIGAGYTNGSTTVPLSSALVNDHANDCYVGNFSSNLVVRPGTLTDTYAAFGMQKQYSGHEFLPKLVDNVQFLGGGQANYQSGGAFTLGFANGQVSTDMRLTLSNCAFAQFTCGGYYNHGKGAHVAPIQITGCVFYSDAIAVQAWSAINGGDPNALLIDGCGVFRVTGFGTSFGINTSNTLGNVVKNSFISGTKVALLSNAALTNVHVFGNLQGLAYEAGTGGATGCTFGTRFAGATNTGNDTFVNAYDGYKRLPIYTYRDTSFSGTLGNSVGFASYTSVTVVNKNLDVTQQEIYRPFMTIKRDNAIGNRSTSSIAIRPLKINTDCTRELLVPCANGASIHIVGYIKRQVSGTQSAGVSVTGLGSAWGGFTAANNNNWQQFDTGNITNSSGADGNFTLTYTVADTASTTGVVYFDGVPDSPFVTKCRHYGFTFDEASTSRTVNVSSQVNEAAASAYTGVTVGFGTSSSSVTLGASRSFQYAYDSTQYQSCQTANLTKVTPLTGVGAAGAVSLFANGDVTTTGYTLNGGGSLSMGAYTLTGSVPWAYTYTGGTFTQAAAVPSFNGGTLAIGAAGTYTFTMAGSTLVVLTPTAPSSYTLSAGSFTGTLTINNAAAHAITVYVPTGVTTSTAGNTGGAITFSSQAVLTVAGIIVGSDVVIRSAGTSTVLGSVDSNATNSWDFGYETPSLVDIDVIKPGYVPLPLVRNYMLPSTNATLPASQQVDRNYAA